MTSYSAIKIGRDTIVAMLSNVANVPAGRERLVWAMLNYPYQPSQTYYYVGGNYAHLNQPDYSRQIFTEEELGEIFEYRQPAKVNGKPNPAMNWFLVRLREDKNPE